jgi:hypothetical protein
MSRLARCEGEAGFLIDVACCRQHAVGPQRDLCVSHSARKPHAFVNQLCADTQPTALRIDQEQTDARDTRQIILDQDYATDVFAIQFCDPAALAFCIEVVDEIGDDLRTKAFERSAPPYSCQ